MMDQQDKKATTQWKKSAISFKNYQDYIEDKSEKFNLSLIDLLYVSNFKGGNATINEAENIINNKLKAYSKGLIDINNEFNNQTLAFLTADQVNLLIVKILEIYNLTKKESGTKIDGFSTSYLSALLSAYFPDLIPILDRRVLINLGLVKMTDIDKSRQIKKIHNFYPELIKRFAELSREKALSIREIDESLFTIKLNSLSLTVIANEQYDSE